MRTTKFAVRCTKSDANCFTRRTWEVGLFRGVSGQSLVETALVLPLLLMVVFNAINFGYYLLVAVNLAAAPRSGALYSILGSATPANTVLPAASPSSANTSISYLVYQDLTGALHQPTGAGLQICSEALGLNNPGQPTQTSICWQSANWGTACGPLNTAKMTPVSDPESPNFVLHRVDICYQFSPLIPGTPFGITLLPSSVCSSSGGTVTCTFHRQVSMRAMN